MSFGKFILIALLGLVVAEAGVFLLVAKAIGGVNALFLLVATSVLGGAVLARMGRKLAAAIAIATARQDAVAMPVRPGDLMTVLGGLLLVLPGFLSDIAGILLLIPPIQRRIAAAFPARWQTRRDDIVDLAPDQWRDLPEARIAKKRDEAPDA